jgi:H+/gluconate symporter-like permease
MLINSSQAVMSYQYLLVPFYLFSWTTSPVPSVLHLIIVAANYSALKGWKFCLSICIAILVSGHFNFIVTVPAYFCLLRNASTMKHRRPSLTTANKIDEKTNNKKSSFKFLVFAMVLSIGFLMLLQFYNRHNGNKNQSLVNARTVYRILTRQNGSYNQPASGIFWYLDVQAFDQFSQYFTTLITHQPVLFCIPLLVRLSLLKPLHTVSFYRKIRIH